MINKIITKFTKKQFAKALMFEEGILPLLPFCDDNKQRLLYIHIPFCEELCPYCSFHRVRFDELLVRKYFKALISEIKIYKEKNYSFSGIYVGGGTPTVLIDELANMLQYAKKSFPVRQISVETNPNHLTAEIIKLLREAGVNRLSVGVQTLNNDLLKKISRFEKYGSGETISEKLSKIKGLFDTINADMIFNFPSQTHQMLYDDLDILRNLKMDQVTFYPLMVSTITQGLMSKTMGEVDFNREKKYYEVICSRMENDYDYSSAWCFSRKTGKKALIDEYVVDYDEYAGLGSGAIGYVKGTCYSNTFDINQYIASLDQNVLPLMASRSFNLQDQMRYDFLMKLFSTKLNVEEIEKKYNANFLKTLWKEMVAFTLTGSFRYFSPYFHLTPWGRYFWVIMMREFFISVNNFREFCRNKAAIS